MRSSTYHHLGLVMCGLLPLLASLKGLMIPANVTLLVPAAAFLVLFTGRWREIGLPSLSDLGLIGLVTFMLLRVLASLNVVLEQPLEYGLHVVSLLLVCPFMYFAGRVMATGLRSEEASRLLALNVVIVIGFLVITIAAPEFVRRNGLEASSYYQYMGDGLAITALIAWARGYRPRFYWPYLLTAVLLVSIGSRASAVAYVVAMAFSNLRFMLTAGIVAAPVGLWLLGAIERGAGLDWAGQFRVLSTFLDFYLQDAEDASFSERQQYFDNAMNVIQNNPLSGQVAYEVRGGELGEFVHNILHLWANFGALAFLLMLLVIFGAPAARLFSKSPASDRHALPLLAFVATELLFFRHPENVVLFFALGVLATFYAQRNDLNSAPYLRQSAHVQ
jgi:hypothetical protein